MPKPLPVLPRAEDVASSLDFTAELLVPQTAPMSGHVLAAVVRIAEGPLGVPISTQVVKHKAGGILQVLRQQLYPEEPQLLNIPQAPVRGPTDVPEASFRSPEDFLVVDTADAAARVAAALQTLPGHPSAAEAAAAAGPEAAAKPRPSIMDYHTSYSAGVITPSAVAERVIKFLEAHNDKNHWLSAWSAQHIRDAAAAATERYAAGKPLSVLDGVPFVVKDCIDALPYDTSYGTRFMAQLHPVQADAPGVAVLKELGAVLLGKTNMNEFGCLATGHNTHLGSARNPHNPDTATGGSSAGSAAAVAAGLCPFALGTDGGGSIRIPASLCGVMGLKTTKGRLADDHGAHSCFSSLTVTGPIATTAADLLLVYAALANTDYHKGSSTHASTQTGSKTPKKGADTAVAAAAALEAPPLQPLELPRELLPTAGLPKSLLQQQLAVGGSMPAGWKPLAGVTFGVCKQWYTMCDPGVLAVVDKAAEDLFKLGASLVDLQIPELDLLQVAHSAVFAAEFYYDAGQAGWRKDKLLRKQLNLDSRMFFANAGLFTDADYTTALRIRARARSHFERAFKQCDVIITPATPTTAPAFTPAVHFSGVYDVAKTFESIRFTQAASLLGLPALVLPAGCVEADGGMPVGVQLMGQPFAEALLLKAAAALETRTQQVLPAAVLLPPLSTCSSSSADSSATLAAEGVSTPVGDQPEQLEQQQKPQPQQQQETVVIKAKVRQDEKLKKKKKRERPKQQQQQPAAAAAAASDRSWLPRLFGSRRVAAAGAEQPGSKTAVKAV